MINVKDKVVLITGAGGGIGREHALEFGRRGAKVVVNDLGSNVRGDGVSNLASNVAAEIVQLGGAAVLIISRWLILMKLRQWCSRP